ncbi:unnamed protein product [Dovyalis caffra]|uniref:Uncharacterized protein n=1 Tax=Dovyalis caffra TaxID=77055 RepID=A0AAV1QR26_9ROSI|nr:unnamed protein product [Dovyalis caffra]
MEACQESSIRTKVAIETRVWLRYEIVGNDKSIWRHATITMVENATTCKNFMWRKLEKANTKKSAKKKKSVVLVKSTISQSFRTQKPIISWSKKNQLALFFYLDHPNPRRAHQKLVKKPKLAHKKRLVTEEAAGNGNAISRQHSNVGETLLNLRELLLL